MGAVLLPRAILALREQAMRLLGPILFAGTAGLFFAVCQVGYFIQLEFYLSATVVSFYATLGMWLLGGGVGLLIRNDSVTLALMATGLCAYYVFGWALRQYPYDLRLLPLYLSLLFVTALYSGYFFRHARAQFDHAKSLFFHENNGFLLGYVLAVLELLLHGQVSVQVLPATTAVGHLLVWAWIITRTHQEK